MVVVLGALEQRVDRNRYRTDEARPQEGRDPTGTVEGDQEHTFLAPHAKVEERLRRAAGQGAQLGVGDLATRVMDGDLLAPTLEVAAEQVGGDVVSVRQVQTHLPRV